jgi:hypothetical protein
MYRGGGEEEMKRRTRRRGRKEGERERERERKRESKGQHRREASIPHLLRKRNYALFLADRGETERD